MATYRPNSRGNGPHFVCILFLLSAYRPPILIRLFGLFRVFLFLFRLNASFFAIQAQNSDNQNFCRDQNFYFVFDI